MNDPLERSVYAGTSPVASLTPVVGSVTLVEGRTFMLSGRSGDMTAELPHGLFVLDTRVLAGFELQLDGRPLEPLAVELVEPFAATFVSRAGAVAGEADSSVVVFRRRHIGDGLRERIRIANHGLDEVALAVELRCTCDFADLFEVKERRVVPRAHDRAVVGGELRFTRHDVVTKQVAVRFSEPAALEPEQARWRVRLAPGAAWEVCLEVVVSLDGAEIEPRFRCAGEDTTAMPNQRLARWRAMVPQVESDNAAFTQAIRRSAEDLGALRIFDPEDPDSAVLAAGAPWFMTVFGRDSLLTAWMTLIADSSLARGVLRTLARFQGQVVDDETEEEPGKILHEMRFASASASALGRGDIYYGSVDATPLFVMLLGELRRWDRRDEVVDQLLPHADRALDWITQFGDRDGDGYVEYAQRSPHGLANQGWKDSWDSIRHVDGTLATAPIALCEVQGYVYAAYIARAHFAHEMGDETTYEHWAQKAQDLRQRFNEDFWLDHRGWFALGLDADKRPIEALTSNIGHCLWTGIVEPDLAAIVAERLMSSELFSGWGVRTLATTMRAFNPVSYHNGSVWPHDNALCAAGLARYGHVEAAHRIITAQLDVASSLGGRLPELFAGFDREELSVPAAYPASCSPQAWSAASPLLWLRTVLRLDPWAPGNQIWMDPQLPPTMRHLRVEGIRIGDQRLTLDIDSGRADVHGLGDVEIITAPRPTISALTRRRPA
jgi:glycogen debranching enzyme